MDSNPPPTATLAAAISASQTANAFLHPRTPELRLVSATNGESHGAGEPAGGSAAETAAETPETRATAPQNGPERKDHQTVVNGVAASIGEDSALAH